jgi:glutamate:Na+ symporter, ESS family
MQAVTDRYGPSPVAILLVPIVGAFFLDIVNAIVVKLFLLLPLYNGH